MGFALAPVALVAYLLVLSHVRPRTVWFGRGRFGRDVLRGAGVAALVGSTGLAFYLAMHALGLNLTVVPDSLSHLWWHYPVLVLSALQNAVLEECVVIGFVLLRLRELGLVRRHRDRAQRPAAGQLSPLPGLRRLPGQPGHGAALRLALPALGPDHPAHRHPHAARRRGLRRLRPAGRPRLLDPDLSPVRTS